MKLLYLYIDSVRDIFHNQGVSFSDEYLVKYNRESGTIIINENENRINNFFGGVVSDIVAIVGKNGVGKTLLLNLIGLNMLERINLSGIDESGKPKDAYFLLYHKTKNRFFCEYFGFYFFSNIKKINGKRNHPFLGSFYFEKNENGYFEIENDNEVEADDSIFYLNNPLHTDIHLFDFNSELASKIDSYLPRKDIGNIKLAEWYRTYIKCCRDKYISSSRSKMLFKRNIDVHSKYVVHLLPNEEKGLYNTKHEKLQRFVEEIDDFFVHYAECLLSEYGRLCLNERENNNDKVIEILSWLREKYSSRRRRSRYTPKECLNILDKYYNCLSQANCSYGLLEYIKLGNDFFKTILQVKKYIYPRIDGFHIQLCGDKKSRKIEKVLNILDQIRELLEHSDDENDYYIDPTMRCQLMPSILVRIEMSSGEQKFINLISHIAHEFSAHSVNQPICLAGHENTCILLVDEIEMEMHLEWSRNLISALIKMIEELSDEYIDNLQLFGGIKSRDLGMRIQLIFTTHSPFVLSDLPRHSIIALKKKGKYTICHETFRSFAQNIQIIMANNFFLDNVYGEWACIKLKNIISRLQSRKKIDIDELNQMRLIIDEIGEDFLRDNLSKQLFDKMELKNKDDKILKEMDMFLNSLREKYPRYSKERMVRLFFSNFLT